MGRALIPILAAACLASPMPAHADGHGDYDGDNDHDFARDLYEHGEIRALHDVLSVVRQQVTGDIIGVELLQVSNKWIYRFQVVAPDGRRAILDVEAGPATPTGRRTED